jgi:two-component system sensor kinase FixL
MKTAILESLTSGVAVIDRGGRVRAVNENWSQMMRESEGPSYPAVHVGDNLLESFRAAAERGNLRLMDAVTGVAAVMDGARDRFSFEHVEPKEGGRWWAMLVARLKDADGGAVVTYAEITERRRAELDAQRSRQDLAHVGRLSTMGALAVSLAHQLNQPLAAIMANVQSAQRLLDRPRVDLPELRAILGDVVADDRRAAEVIQRLRELLKKSGADLSRVDLAAAINDVATLVQSDAVIRNVALTIDCDGGGQLFVHGDRIQLQQVVLNLLVNALEAFADAPGAERTIRVMCLPHGDLARVVVSDSGVGFDAGAEEVVFEPFYTTKPGGMGMGLSIARSIVEAHGGHIAIRRERQPGTTIEFTLPLDTTGRR